MKWLEEFRREKEGCRKSRGEIGSPHPLLSPSVIPLPFSWLTLFGHVTAAIAGGERMRKGKGWPDCSFFSSFRPLRIESFGLMRGEVRGKPGLRGRSG